MAAAVPPVSSSPFIELPIHTLCPLASESRSCTKPFKNHWHKLYHPPDYDMGPSA